MTEADGIPFSMSEKVVAAILALAQSIRVANRPDGTQIDADDVLDTYDYFLVEGRRMDLDA